MKICVFPDNAAIAGKPIMDAFISSIHENVYINDMDGDVAIIWSVLWNGRMAKNEEIWNHFRSQGKPVIVLEVGSLKRGVTWKVRINGLNNDADFCNQDFGDRRVKILDLKLTPWKKYGNHIIICGQHGKSEQWKGMPSMDQWMIDVCNEIRQHTAKKIIMRPHPRFPMKSSPDIYNVEIATPSKIDGSYDDFDFPTLLGEAHATVCHSSGPGVISIMNGVPAYTSTSSLAYDMSRGLDELSLIDSPKYHDRYEWLCKLSYTEWTLDEILRGVAWERVKKRISTPTHR